MNVETIRVKKTLKCGKTNYAVGTMIDSRKTPIPPDLIEELRLNTGTVEEVSFSEYDRSHAPRMGGQVNRELKRLQNARSELVAKGADSEPIDETNEEDSSKQESSSIGKKSKLIQ